MIRPIGDVLGDEVMVREGVPIVGEDHEICFTGWIPEFVVASFWVP